MLSRNPRHRPLPKRWLFTDEERGGDPRPAMKALPRGSGVIFRHYGAADREAMARECARIARRRGLTFVVAGDADLARRVGAAGVHMPGFARMHRPLTAAAHDRAELVRAGRAGARLIFVSPVFATRSHPGAATLGPAGFGRLVRGSRVAVAALGGMTRARYRALKPLGAAGWGGISAFR